MTWILGGIAVAATLVAMRNWLLRNRAMDFNTKLGVTLGVVRQDNQVLERELDKHRNLLVAGCGNLKTKMWRFEPEEHEQPSGMVAVVGQSALDPRLYFVVKKFAFDYDDPDDREFAVRCAEELIETIQNA